MKHIAQLDQGCRRSRLVALFVLFATTGVLSGAVPNAITYQGRVSVAGTPFTGVGYFKFALVAPDGVNQVWRNDGLSDDTEPPVSVAVRVDGGLFTVVLGDNSVLGMALLPPDLLVNNPVLKVRTWFNDGTNGSVQLTPDIPLTSSPYALVSATALTVPDGSITASKIAAGAVGTAQLASNAVTAGQLAPGAAASNLAASALIGMPSGTIILSEAPLNPGFVEAGFTAYGGSLTLNGDHWTSVPAGPPATGALNAGRYGHNALWNGTYMFVAGGTPTVDPIRYHPGSNVWTVLNKSNAPPIGEEALLAWTGTRLLVWDPYHRVGGRYNPATDTWLPMSDTNAPTARAGAAGAFVGGYFVVWGGRDTEEPDVFYRTGGRYNPANDTWTATSLAGAPTARTVPTGVATPTEALFFGGHSTTEVNINPPTQPPHYIMVPVPHASGGRYNPSANTWTAMADAPDPRYAHTATWSGTHMYVFGGIRHYFACLNCFPFVFADQGMRYDVAADAWSLLPTNSQPNAVLAHVAVWSGSQLLIWGGRSSDYQALNSGGRYNPLTATWTSMALPADEPRLGAAGIWSGTQLIVWGGQRDDNELDTGLRYTPGSDSWTSTASPPATGEPSERNSAATVWTGNALIVWGGRAGSTRLRTGGIYRPGVGWTNTPAAGAPSARSGHTAIWSGTEMIVWGGEGGFGNTPFNTGARFNILSNRWFPMSTVNAPRARADHSASWTGSEMIVWGGYDYTNSFYPTFLADGARYNPTNDTWTALPPLIVPPRRAGHTAVWTGKEMLIWGGYSHSGGVLPTFSYFNQGFAYNLESNSWRLLPSSGLSGRRTHSAVWSGEEMFIWGGAGSTGQTNTGARYHPLSNAWTTIITNSAPVARSGHSAIWSDYRMIVWGGVGATTPYLSSGAMFDPYANTWTSMTNTTAVPRDRHGAAWTGSEMIIVNGRSLSSDLGNDPTHNSAFHPRRILYFYQKP